MNAKLLTANQWLIQHRQFAGRILLALLLLVLVLFVSQSKAQTASTINLEVREYNPNGGPGSGPLISMYTYLVNEDNTGDPFDPDPNNHPSLKPMASHSPVVMTGTSNSPSITLEDGRYLVSVRADGYKLGGAHVSLPDDTGTVLVELVKEPLPLSRIRVHVFHDRYPVNGENDIPREPGLEGFRVVIDDTAGEVTVDWYGNPICTRYDGVLDGNEPTPLGYPIPNSGGACYTDANGDLLVDNLPRGKYEVLVIPPDGEEYDWVQTTTIEGTHVIDAWITEGFDGYSPREGFQQAGVWVGFIQRCSFGDTTDTCPNNDTAGAGTIQGTVKTIIEWTPPVSPLTLGQEVDRPWIALTDIGNNDEQVYLGRGNPDGSFQINNVPDGLYQMAIWDEPLDYIISFRTVQVDSAVNGGLVDMGVFGIPRWFGWLSGHVFLDTNQNGVRDAGEVGMSGVDLAMRFRDGTVRYGAVTDNDGFYEFPEVFELEKFYVTEVGFGRWGATGATVHDEFVSFDPNDPNSYQHYDGALTVANLNWAAKRSTVDWGKHVYAPGENGGISGIIMYATTRNELDSRFAAAEDYEPGIPNVRMHLYDETGTTLLNEVFTDAYEHPTDCTYTDANGNPVNDPLGLGPKCIEVPNISNEVKEGLFDGGYAFEEDCHDYSSADPTALLPPDQCTPLPPGDYVVEVHAPTGYKVLSDADVNTSDGNDLVPQLNGTDGLGLIKPELIDAPCDGNDCSRRLVTLKEGQNAAADFFLLTNNAVPIPGRIYGFLLDDVNVETDPSKIYYGEKRGIPNTPVGIRDFTGRLIATVHSDENGIFEVLLPSTYVADCPTPSGVCPAMYSVTGNDPGTPENPNPDYNPNYQSRTFIFDVWPGKATFADVALFPITAFAEFPGSQFQSPASCAVAPGIPDVQAVSEVALSSGSVAVHGAGFGATQGSGRVRLSGISLPVASWSDTAIQVNIPAFFPRGAHQLLVEAGNGETSPSGITLHLLGSGYNPPVVWVDSNAAPGGNGSSGAPFDTIQAAIDAAAVNSLIVVRPGTYYDDVVMNKQVRIQGYGPGAPDGFGTGGSVLDMRFATVGFHVTAAAPGTFTATFNPRVDGLRIVGARDQQDVGGGLHTDINAQNLTISNNVIQSNGGNLGGGITLGEPYRGDNNNDNIRIVYNRILNNGGISLAGGLAIYNGADNYEIAYNDICGNYSAEYGGGISHFGLSNDGRIHHNRIYYNNAFDEGGGIMIAGEQFTGAGPNITTGSGDVIVSHNLIQANLSNDDGGAIRTLQPWDYSILIVNNMIVNNVSTDIGGGISLDDASDVIIVNNTIAKNANTSTAEDSDGLPHAAGLVSEGYSQAFTDYLETTYGPGASAPGFPDPVMFNNIFWENQAYTWDATNGVLVFDSIRDLEVFGVPGAHTGHPTNLIGVDPSFVDAYDTQLDAVAFRQEPNFVTVVMVTVNVTAELPGDYHLLNGSVAENAGTAGPVQGIPAPCNDFDDERRPYNGAHDVGADELPNGSTSFCLPGGGGGGFSNPLSGPLSDTSGNGRLGSSNGNRISNGLNRP